MGNYCCSKSIYSHKISETKPISSAPDLRSESKYIWYFSEDHSKLVDHPYTKHGNFFAYPPDVSEYIEQKYIKRTVGQLSPIHISYKQYNHKKYTKYIIDFVNLNQINVCNGCKIKITRLDNYNYFNYSLTLRKTE
jgi:hypothetical protein